MLKKLALFVVASTLTVCISSAALADNGSVLRVIEVNTPDVSTYIHELDKGQPILKRLGISTQSRVWVATLAGPNTGSVIVTQEYATEASFADAMAKTSADSEFNKWIKGLDKIRVKVSDSIYLGQN